MQTNRPVGAGVNVFNYVCRRRKIAVYDPKLRSIPVSHTRAQGVSNDVRSQANTSRLLRNMILRSISWRIVIENMNH